MHHRNQFKMFHLLLLSFAIFLMLGPVLLRAADSAQSELDAVWQRVQQSGAYRFSADVTQTNTPQATVFNAGRQGKTTSLYLEGGTDIEAESLHLTLWSNGGSALVRESGMEIQVDGQSARARQGGGAWEAIDDFTGLFAPGGDFMAYVHAAKEVVRHDPEIRTTPRGELRITRYTFAIDGRRFAEHMHGQMREQAMRAGLPAQAQIELPQTYLHMTGTGELWVGADGLPVRQHFSLQFPETGDGYVTAAEMRVNFSDFAPLPPTALSYRMEHALQRTLDGASLPGLALTLAAFALTLWGLVLVITRRRSRVVYISVISVVILSMVSVPWLNSQQVSAYATQQAQKRSDHEAAQTEQETQDEVRAQLKTTDFDPHRDPLAAAQQSTALAEAAQSTNDDESNGRFADPLCESDPNGDADGDTLTNLEECLLGTLVEYADTDQDGVDDNVEVAGFQLPGSSTVWYSDPNEPDTNRDGMGDGEEWYLDANGNQIPDDTDGDGTPDLWDEDNDGDAVPDELDMSVYANTASSKTFSENVPLQLTLDELTAGELVKVEFQLKPTDPDHLWYSHNVLDWPVNDLRGHLQDADGLTFADVDSTTNANPNAGYSPDANGDMRMVPLLEIQIPVDSPNLPPTGTCGADDGDSGEGDSDEGDGYDCYPLLEQFGISTHRLSEAMVAAYVPLQLVSDGNGDSNVAFYGRMIYQAAGVWQNAHSVRLLWAIQMLNDVCAEFDDGICVEYDAYNQLQIIQTYYDDWYLTGLMVTEDHSADIALIYEDPAAIAPGENSIGGNHTGEVDDAPLYLDTLYALLYGLDMSFLAGRDCDSTDSDGQCVGDGERDITVREIARRFNHSTNSGVSDQERWDLPNVLGVVAHSYESIDLGMMDTTITQTVALLESTFRDKWSAEAPILPTIMMATEESYRALNLDQTAGGDTYFNWNANALTVTLAQSGDHAVEAETLATLKWTPYAFDPASGWSTAEITEFLDEMALELEDGFDGITDPDETATYQTMAQVLYMAVYNGASYVVQIGEKVSAAAYGESDIELEIKFGTDVGTLLILGLTQYFDYSEALRDAAQPMQDQAVLRYYDIKWREFWRYQFDLYGHRLVAFGALAFSAVAYIILFTTLIVKLADQDAWAGWDTLSASAMIYLTVVMNIIVPIRAALYAAQTVGGVVQWGVFLKALTTVQKIKSAVGYAALVGLIITIGIAIGIFIWAWASGRVSPGEVAFYSLLATTIASIIIAIIIFIVSLTVVGAIIISIIVLIDAILLLVGEDFSITGFFTDLLASIIYRYSVAEPKVTSGTLHSELQDPARGFEAGNTIRYSLPITTTIATGLSVPSSRTVSNSMIYALDDKARQLSTSIGDRKYDWVRVWPNLPWSFGYALLVDEPTYSTPLQAGLNAPVKLYLNAAYALRGRSCWLIFICSDDDAFGHVSEYITQVYVGDVLPATLDEFVDVGAWGRNPDRGVQGDVRFLDPDGDGLLARSDGGLDPDNSRWDSDDDGLNDGYEVLMRSIPPDQGGVNLNPQSNDSDGDGVLDAVELRYGSNPAHADTDGDGLSDAVEILPGGGWDLPYRYDAATGATTATRVWSNPLSSDIDGDGLSDLFERSQIAAQPDPWADPANPQIFNPYMWNQSPVALYVDDATTDGYVVPGATVAYTTTTENNLGNGQELVGQLSLDVPENVSGGPLSAPVHINNGEQASLVSNLTFAGQESATYDLTSRTQLTNFFETRWAWDAASASGQTTLDNPVEALAIAAPTGWDAPFVVATLEQNTPDQKGINLYMVESDGTVVNANSLRVETSAKGRPDIACNEQGTCLLVWEEFSAGWSQFVNNGLSLGSKAQLSLQQSVSAPTVATDGTDFAVAWSAYTDFQQTNLYYSVRTIPENNIGGSKTFGLGQLNTQTGAINIAWNGSTYTAVWSGDGTMRRANIDPDAQFADPSVVIGTGGGWPQSDGMVQAPSLVHDPISNRTLLAYRDPSGRAMARTLTAGSTSDPLPLVESGVDGNDVTVALAPDRENNGWVMAWVPSDGGSAHYRAISPVGSLRGESSGFDQAALTAVALACSRPRATVDLPFDEDAGATVFEDTSGNGRDAVCADACPQSGTSGILGNAVSFNGIDESLRVDDVDLADSSFTLATWGRVDDFSNPSFIMSIGDYDSNASRPRGEALSLMASENRFQCQLLKVGSVRTAPTVEAGKWYHSACTYDKESGRLTLYLNGEAVESTIFSDGYIGNNTLRIGRRYTPAAPNSGQFFNGSLDSLQIVDRALSAEEIREIAHRTVAAYSLDEPAGSELFVNAVGDGLNGRCDSTATCPTLGVPGAAFTAAQFDGQNDSIAIGDQNNALALANASFTISAWARRDEAGQGHMILSQGQTSNNQGLQLGFRPNNLFTCAFWGNDLNTTATYTDTDWHHWACTYDAESKQQTLYRDGQEIERRSASGNYIGTGVTYIGQRLDNNWHFSGAIDEVGIWQTALTANQIQTLFNKVKVVDESVLTCQLPAASGNTVSFNNLVLRQTTTELGEINQSIERSITVDAEPPVTSIVGDYFGPGGGEGYVRSPQARVIAGEADDVTSYITQVEVDAGNGWQTTDGVESWAFLWDTSGLPDGPYTVRVRATDVAGNRSTPSSWTTILDNTPPVATIAAPPSPMRPQRDASGHWRVSLSGSVTDPEAGARPGSGVHALDVLLHGIDDVAGLAWQAATLADDGTWQIDYVLPEFIGKNNADPAPTGTYSVTVRATDALSNTTAAAAYPTALVALDATGPGVAASEALSDTLHITSAFDASGVVSDTAAVTAVEVNLTPAQQMGALDGVMLHLPFDERHATGYFVDQSGANNVATCDAAHCPAVGEPGQRDRAARFDGGGFYLQTPPPLDPAAGPFSAAVWFNATAVDGDHYLLQQADGMGMGRTWLAVTGGTVRSNLGGAGLDGTVPVAANTWHHAAITYDGATLTLYVDGVVDSTTTAVMEASDGDLLIGAFKHLNRFYDGLLDELVVYDRALSAYEVLNLYEYGQGTWAQATLEENTWRYTIPTGSENGLEGLYQLNVRGIDALGNVTPQGGQRVWRGEIDTRPPQVTFTIDTDTSGNTTTTTYTCTATDYNLVEETTCLPGQTPAIPTFRDSDATLTSYDAVDPWYAANITDTARLYTMEAERTYPNPPVADQTMTTCDAYDHCSEAAVTLLPTTLHLLDAEILGPSGGTVLTTTAAVTVSGEVYAQDGLRMMAVDLNGSTVHTQKWETAETTVAPWHFQWTPPGEGIYRFEPLVDSWAGETPPVRTSRAGPVTAQAELTRQQWQGPTASPEQLTERTYLPLVASGGSSTGGLGTNSLIYLPLMATEGEPVTGAFTGTVTTLYVDLTPPSVDIDATVLTSTHALAEPVVLLTGSAADSVQLHQVDVRIDDGLWQRAGFDTGRERWQWQWWFDNAPDGELFTISARAEDLAGRLTTVTETVLVDTVAPVPSTISLAVVTSNGQKTSIEPGATLSDAAALEVSWAPGSDGGGPIRYEVGFSSDSTPAPAELTLYAEASTHQVSVSDAKRLYATVRYVDAVGNVSVVTVGPVTIVSGG